MPTETQTTISKDGLSEEVLDYIDGLEGENNTLAKALDEATDELIKADDSTDDDFDDDDVTKGLDPEVADLVKGILAPVQAENAELRETIDGERDIRLTTEQIEKAAAFGFGDSTELGEVMKSVMQNCGTDIYDTLVKSFSAASEQIKDSALFDEVGSDQRGVPNNDVSKAASLNEAADELVSKGTAKTRVEAIRQLVATSPDLFTTEGD